MVQKGQHIPQSSDMRCSYTRVYVAPIHHTGSTCGEDKNPKQCFLPSPLCQWMIAGGGRRHGRHEGLSQQGKCGFDLEFRLKIHQDLLNRCICQAGGDTQSGLHNHILFGCSRAQVLVYVCVCICVHVKGYAYLLRRQKRNLYSLLDLSVISQNR